MSEGTGMSLIPSHHRLSPRIALLARATLIIFALVNLILIAKAALAGIWILDPQGRAVPADFISFWSTSRMLQAGPAHYVYDWALHHAAELDVLGQGRSSRFPWLNPPIFLLAVAPLAFLPYSAAFLTWLAVTFAAYAAALRTILLEAPSRWILIGACAFPATLSTAAVGQNGLLTGALVGGTLGLLERRPVLAGILLGLLTYKPQFGILFPIVLVASGHWRVIAAAGITTLLLLGVTTAIFGAETWLAFLNSAQLAQEAVLVRGQMGVYKLQSVYGSVLWLSGNTAAAWATQAVVAAGTALALAWLWRKQVSMEVKAAALGAGILLATPYALIYDFMVLSVPMAFLIRAGLARGFGALELPFIFLACLLVFAFPVIGAPVGPAAVLLVILAVAQRAASEGGRSMALPHTASP